MHNQALRTYLITFTGRDEKGVIPMHTRVQAMTGKAAVKAFVARYKPVSGWLLGDPEDITERVLREGEGGAEHAAEMNKAG